jgi:hypothetical protein
MEKLQSQFNYLPNIDFKSFYTSFAPPVDYSKMTEEELIAELKKSSDFDKLVFPNSFYSKYELPEKKCLNMKEYLKESPWLTRSQHYYIEKKDIPAKPGGNRPILEAPEVPAITLLENNFSDKPTTETETSNQQETPVS